MRDDYSPLWQAPCRKSDSMQFAETQFTKTAHPVHLLNATALPREASTPVAVFLRALCACPLGALRRKALRQ